MLLPLISLIFLAFLVILLPKSYPATFADETDKAHQGQPREIGGQSASSAQRISNRYRWVLFTRRPTKITPYIQELRQEVKANFCLYLSNQTGDSYSSIWTRFFLNKNQPKKPRSHTTPETNVRFWCGKYPREIKAHLHNVLDPDTGGREALAELLKTPDNK